jgi:hypothetical protein
MFLLISFAYVQLLVAPVYSRQIDRESVSSIAVSKSIWIYNRLVSVTSADGDTTNCVGTRLTRQWVITSANCVPMFVVFHFYVKFLLPHLRCVFQNEGKLSEIVSITSSPMFLNENLNKAFL